MGVEVLIEWNRIVGRSIFDQRSYAAQQSRLITCTLLRGHQQPSSPRPPHAAMATTHPRAAATQYRRPEWPGQDRGWLKRAPNRQRAASWGRLGQARRPPARRVQERPGDMRAGGAAYHHPAAGRPPPPNRVPRSMRAWPRACGIVDGRGGSKINRAGGQAGGPSKEGGRGAVRREPVDHHQGPTPVGCPRPRAGGCCVYQWRGCSGRGAYARAGSGKGPSENPSSP